MKMEDTVITGYCNKMVVMKLLGSEASRLPTGNKKLKLESLYKVRSQKNPFVKAPPTQDMT